MCNTIYTIYNTIYSIYKILYIYIIHVYMYSHAYILKCETILIFYPKL